MKIISISHSDLDGSICSILVKEYARQKGIECEVIKYGYGSKIDLNQILEENKNNKIIITDISPDGIKNSDNILLIDHHLGSEESEIKNKVVDIGEGTSACRLVYNYFTKAGIVFNEKFTKLMELGHDYDSWTHKYKASKAVNYLFGLYYFYRFVDRFEHGFDKFTEDEQTFLKCKYRDIKNILTNLKYNAINDKVAFVIEENNLSDIAEELYMNRGFLYVFIYSPKRNSMSMRCHNDALINCGEFLELFGGGGHRNSGGVVVKDEKKIDEILKAFEIVYDEFHSIF